MAGLLYFALGGVAMTEYAVSKIVDDLYEAAAVADLWPRALESITSLINGAGASLFAASTTFQSSISTPFMSQVIEDFAAMGKPELNRRSPRAIALRHPGFLTDLDVFTEDEIRTDPFYVEVLRPRGLGWCAGTAIFVPGGDTLIVSIERRFELGPVSRECVAALDQLRPHIARAAAFSARLALERVRAATEALGLVGLPAAVIGMNHRVLAANSLFEALVPGVFCDRRHGISLANSAADALLSDALARNSVRSGGGVQSIPISASEEREAMVVHLLPIRGAAHDIFASASAIILATPVTTGQAPSQQLLEGLFDLSPAEARVARAIASGETVEAIAAAHRTSAQTIRTQLKSVFAKTGAHRQAELVRLLAGGWHFGDEISRT